MFNLIFIIIYIKDGIGLYIYIFCWSNASVLSFFGYRRQQDRRESDGNTRREINKKNSNTAGSYLATYEQLCLINFHNVVQ